MISNGPGAVGETLGRPGLERLGHLDLVVGRAIGHGRDRVGIDRLGEPARHVAEKIRFHDDHRRPTVGHGAGQHLAHHAHGAVVVAVHVIGADVGPRDFAHRGQRHERRVVCAERLDAIERDRRDAPLAFARADEVGEINAGEAVVASVDGDPRVGSAREVDVDRVGATRVQALQTVRLIPFFHVRLPHDRAGRNERVIRQQRLRAVRLANHHSVTRRGRAVRHGRILGHEHRGDAGLERGERHHAVRDRGGKKIGVEDSHARGRRSLRIVPCVRIAEGHRVGERLPNVDSRKRVAVGGHAFERGQLRGEWPRIGKCGVEAAQHSQRAGGNEGEGFLGFHKSKMDGRRGAECAGNPQICASRRQRGGLRVGDDGLMFTFSEGKVVAFAKLQSGPAAATGLG